MPRTSPLQALGQGPVCPAQRLGALLGVPRACRARGHGQGPAWGPAGSGGCSSASAFRKGLHGREGLSPAPPAPHLRPESWENGLPRGDRSHSSPHGAERPVRGAASAGSKTLQPGPRPAPPGPARGKREAAAESESESSAVHTRTHKRAPRPGPARHHGRGDLAPRPPGRLQLPQLPAVRRGTPTLGSPHGAMPLLPAPCPAPPGTARIALLTPAPHHPPATSPCALPQPHAGALAGLWGSARVPPQEGAGGAGGTALHGTKVLLGTNPACFQLVPPPRLGPDRAPCQPPSPPRNTALEQGLVSQGFQAPKARKTGTTIAGLVCAVSQDGAHQGVGAGAEQGLGGGMEALGSGLVWGAESPCMISALTPAPPQDGVVLGADTRATDDMVVAEKNCLKIHYLAPNI